jgi:hypothetical protein
MPAHISATILPDALKGARPDESVLQQPKLMENR